MPYTGLALKICLVLYRTVRAWLVKKKHTKNTPIDLSSNCFVRIPVVGTTDVIRHVEDLGSSFAVQVGKSDAKRHNVL